MTSLPRLNGLSYVVGAAGVDPGNPTPPPPVSLLAPLQGSDTILLAALGYVYESITASDLDDPIPYGILAAVPALAGETVRDYYQRWTSGVTAEYGNYGNVDVTVTIADFLNALGSGARTRSRITSSITEARVVGHSSLFGMESWGLVAYDAATLTPFGWDVGGGVDW